MTGIPQTTTETEHLAAWAYGALFGVTLVTFVWTLAPDISYFVDSAEYALTITTLGVAHPPGYPLLMLVGNGFARVVPLGDVTWRLNLLSALALAGTAPVTAAVLLRLTGRRAWAVGGALVGVWSYYLWVTSISVEVYAPQVLAVALLVWSLVRMSGHTPSPAGMLASGALLGLAVATHPINLLFLPGVVLVYGLLGVGWRWTLAALVLGGALTLAVYAYLPIRAESGFTVIGRYTSDGAFVRQDLRSLDGLLYYLTGRQFESYFFAEGVLPTGAQLVQTARLFAENYLYLGALVGVLGVGLLFAQRRGLAVVWLVLFLPYLYFFTTYGADDKITMFGPVLWLFVLPFVVGLGWFAEADWQRWVLAGGVAAAMLGINGTQLRAARSLDLVRIAEARLAAVPADAAVVGPWTPTVQLHYSQRVGDAGRDDVTLVNVDSIGNAPAALAAFLGDALAGRPVVVVQVHRFPAAQQDWLMAQGLAPLPFTAPPTLDMAEALQREFLDYDGDTPLAGYVVRQAP